MLSGQEKLARRSANRLRARGKHAFLALSFHFRNYAIATTFETGTCLVPAKRETGPLDSVTNGDTGPAIATNSETGAPALIF